MALFNFKFMRYFFILLFVFLISCSTANKSLQISEDEKNAFEATTGEAIALVDEESEYELIIIDPGFNNWLNNIARAPGYYSQDFLEYRNNVYVNNWNQRVLLPSQFDSNLYFFHIEYDPRIDYGYDLNYKLYNYFIYFQRKYDQRLGPYLPRI